MKNTLLTCLLCGVLFHLSTGLSYGQRSDSVMFSKVSDAFRSITGVPAEKLYLHTDKPYYFAGDTIWMESYLVNAITHYPNANSQYIYIELIDRKNNVIQRRKFGKRPDGSMPGFFPLPKEITEGDYYIRGYTRWMLNDPSDYFFLLLSGKTFMSKRN